jgi:hypothetical protein
MVHDGTCGPWPCVIHFTECRLKTCQREKTLRVLDHNACFTDNPWVRDFPSGQSKPQTRRARETGASSLYFQVAARSAAMGDDWMN